MTHCDLGENRISLEAIGILDEHDVQLIIERWQDDDWAAHPALFHLREHTKAYIDRLRGEAM
jgi:hypothetical protein